MDIDKVIAILETLQKLKDYYYHTDYDNRLTKEHIDIVNANFWQLIDNSTDTDNR